MRILALDVSKNKQTEEKGENKGDENESNRDKNNDTK